MKSTALILGLFGIVSLQSVKAQSQVQVPAQGTPSIVCLQDDSPVDGPIKKIFIEADPGSNGLLERMVLDFKSYSMTGKITEFTKVLAAEISCRSIVYVGADSSTKNVLLGAGCTSADNSRKISIERNNRSKYVITLEKTINGVSSVEKLMNNGTCEVR